MYLTYSEYQAMGGALAEPIFTRLEMLAEGTVNAYTAHRITIDLRTLENVEALPYAAPLQSLVYMLINLESDTTEQSASSVSNNGISVSYKSGSERTQTVRNMMAMLSGFADQKGTPLLWRGVP